MIDTIKLISNASDEIKKIYCSIICNGSAVVHKRYSSNYEDIKIYFQNNGFHISEIKDAGFEKFYIFLQ